jgi:hypothetical protein
MSDQLLFEGTIHIARANVVGWHDDGRVAVRADDGSVHACDVLRTGQRPVEVHPGDEVLCWLPPSGRQNGVVLGVVRPFLPPTEPEASDELVLEAKKNLTLRCGDGSITIREDGKILIKGKDLVSHAKRLNRIRGGSVQIN